MATSLGEYLHAAVGTFLHKALKDGTNDPESVFKEGLSALNGDGNERNLRVAFKRFKEAHERGHKGATAELGECYLRGRGCEIDIVKAAELGNEKAALKLVEKMEREGRESECVKYLWTASDAGELEATIRLARMYKYGNAVEKDTKESERLEALVGAQYQKAENGLGWRFDQISKTLFIKGEQEMQDYKTPWGEDRQQIETVRIHEGVKSIGKCAFTDFEKLKAVFIPSSVATITSNPFADCPRLSSIHVSEESPFFYSTAGVLVDKRTSTLLSYPTAREGSYEVPNGIVTIGEGAFSGCVGLTSIVLPESVSVIGLSAFENCSNLESVRLQSKLSIRCWAFCGCRKLRVINLEGISSVEENAFLNTLVTLPIAFKPINDEQFIANARKYSRGDGVPMNKERGYMFYSKALSIKMYSTNQSQLYFANNSSLDDREKIDLFVVIGKKLLAESHRYRLEQEGDIEWSYETYSKLLIKGKGPIEDYAEEENLSQMNDYENNPESAPWARKYRKHINSVVILRGISSIGANSFRYCESLNSVEMHFGIKSIRNNAFCNLSQLRSVTLPSSVVSLGKCCFYNCTSLSSIVIPNSVALIGDYAFGQCSELASVTIPDSVKDLGNAVFYQCTKLTSIDIPVGLEAIQGNPFASCTKLETIKLSDDNEHFVLMDQVMYDKEQTVLVYCPVYKKGLFEIPSTVSSIANFAFLGCQLLDSIVISESVTSIGYRAFDGCTSLTSVIIPNSVTSIGENAFSGCTKLETVKIGENVATMKGNLFMKCDFLSSIEVSDDNQYYASIEGVLFNKELSHLICCPPKKDGEYVIPNTVPSIGSCAFFGCSNLTGVTIPSTVTLIESSVFFNCKGLTSITLPDSITSIGKSAFMRCHSMRSVTIPNSVTSIDDLAFFFCAELVSITIPQSVVTIGVNPFGGCTKLLSIQVVDENEHFVSVDGVLFSKDMTILISFPVGKSGEYKIPSSVVTISDLAFAHAYNLKSVTIPDGVVSINERAFLRCSDLESLDLPMSVRKIGEFVFAFCDHLKKILVPTALEYSQGTFPQNTWVQTK